eukprot:342021-Chlamydomonas_euryale.AAC.1
MVGLAHARGPLRGRGGVSACSACLLPEWLAVRLLFAAQVCYGGELFDAIVKRGSYSEKVWRRSPSCKGGEA